MPRERYVSVGNHPLHPNHLVTLPPPPYNPLPTTNTPKPLLPYPHHPNTPITLPHHPTLTLISPLPLPYPQQTNPLGTLLPLTPLPNPPPPSLSLQPYLL